MLEGIMRGTTVQVLTKAQIETIYKSLNNHKLFQVEQLLALIIGLNSGINREEIIRITKMDINLDGGTIYIRGQKKSRMVYLPPSAMARLKPLLIKLNGSTEPIVKYNELQFKEVYAHWSAIAGFPVSWQNIRHTYAELAAQQNVPVKLVAHNIGVEEKTLDNHFDLTPQLINVILKDKMIA